MMQSDERIPTEGYVWREQKQGNEWKLDDERRPLYTFLKLQKKTKQGIYILYLDMIRCTLGHHIKRHLINKLFTKKTVIDTNVQLNNFALDSVHVDSHVSVINLKYI